MRIGKWERAVLIMLYESEGRMRSRDLQARACEGQTGAKLESCRRMIRRAVTSLKRKGLVRHFRKKNEQARTGAWYVELTREGREMAWVFRRLMERNRKQ